MAKDLYRAVNSVVWPTCNIAIISYHDIFKKRNNHEPVMAAVQKLQLLNYFNIKMC